jgi:hypothetical protein
MYNINITAKANDKIQFWVNRAIGEVGGMGIGTYDAATKSFTVTDAFLIEQTVGGAHTDLTAEGMGKLMFQTARMEGDLCFWWHSHSNMPVFWSGTDQETILKLGANGFIFASVFNKKDEVRSACAFTATSALNDGKQEIVFLDDISTTFLNPEMPKELAEELEAQFVALVKTSYTLPSRHWPNSKQEDLLERHGLYDPNSYHGQGYAEWEAMENGNYSEVERIATRNIHDATKQHREEGFFDMEGFPLTNQELDQICTDSSGAFGFGFKDEAEVLKLTHKTYRRIIKSNNLKQLTNLEDKVLLAAAAGQIKHINQKSE